MRDALSQNCEKKTIHTPSFSWQRHSYFSPTRNPLSSDLTPKREGDMDRTACGCVSVSVSVQEKESEKERGRERESWERHHQLDKANLMFDH